MGQVRFNLSLQVIESNSILGRQFMVIDVQAWNGDTHIASVKLADFVVFEWPEHAGRENMEDYALNACRVVARHLADVQMSAIEANSLHTRKSFEQ